MSQGSIKASWVGLYETKSCSKMKKKNAGRHTRVMAMGAPARVQEGARGHLVETSNAKNSDKTVKYLLQTVV